MSGAFDEFKAKQREGWSSFAPLELLTTIPAGRLVRFAGVGPDRDVLDVGCGTGVVAVTAARAGARVRALDLTPALLAVARENAATAQVEVELTEGDVEALPYADATFDFVLSQFGHMFAPRPDVAIGEMLRVLRPGGTIAFATWPPEHFVGQMFALSGRYMPAPPGAAPPPQWGSIETIRQRLGDAVTDVHFDRDTMHTPALSVHHYRALMERTGPLGKLAQTLPPDRLATFRAEFEATVAPYYDGNAIKQDYLLTRARKR